VTRELKLALIVGFLLVMVVTVLLSDHYSKSRQSRLAADMPDRPTLVPDLAPEPDDEPAASVLTANPGRGLGPDVPLTENLETPSPVEPRAMADTSGSPVPGFRTSGLGTGNRANADFAPPTVLTQGSRERQNQLLKEAVDRLSDPIRSVRELIGRETVDNGAGSLPGGGSLVSDAALVADSRPEGRVLTFDVPPVNSDRIHVIASGETLTKVARKYYNDGNMWKQLAAYNPGVTGKNGLVQVGAKLRIPATAVLVRKPAEARPPVREPAPVVTASEQSKPVVRPETKMLPKDAVTNPKAGKSSTVTKAEKVKLPEAKPVKAGSATYTVKKGDTLREIAQKQLGSVARADEIIQLNRKVIKDPNNVPAGAILTLPKV